MTNEDFIQKVSLVGEEWKEIKGYEGRYLISSLGRVAALYMEIITHPRDLRQVIHREPHLLKPTQFRKTKYYYIMFRKEGKRFKYLVHRLVALAFIDNPDNLPQVDHIDGDRLNNKVSNLRWCNARGNMANSITQERVEEGRKNVNFPYRIRIAQIKDNDIICLYNSIYETKKNGFNPASVNKCVNGKFRTYKGFTWVKITDTNKD